MAIDNLTIKVYTAWWLKPYFYGLAIVCALTGRDPDWEKVKFWINRAIRVKAV